MVLKLFMGEVQDFLVRNKGRLREVESSVSGRGVMDGTWGTIYQHDDGRMFRVEYSNGGCLLEEIEQQPRRRK